MATVKPYNFAGPVSAVLYAASSARDTDWFIHLLDIDEKGRPLMLCGGHIDARYRNSLTKPELVEVTFVRACQTIYHDSAHPSYILLPAIDQ